MQQAMVLHVNRFLNFMNFARAFLMRQNFLASIQNAFVGVFKEIFMVQKKKKLAQYRVNYQQFKLRQMEQLIAENNEHVFLRGNKLNELR